MRLPATPATVWSLGLVLLLVGTSSSRADVILSLNTGFDNSTKSLLDPNTVDAKYQVTGPNSGVYYPQARDASGLPLSYIAAPANSRWDYLVTSPTLTGDDFVAVGNYDLRTTVNLTGSDAPTAQINGLRVSADNAFLAVEINGQTVFSRNPTGTVIEDFHSILNVGNLGLGDFHSGLNTVGFIILNQGFGGDGSTEPSPAAFLAVGDIAVGPITTVAPEPSGLLLFGIGALGLFGCRYFQRRQDMEMTRGC